MIIIPKFDAWVRDSLNIVDDPLLKEYIVGVLLDVVNSKISVDESLTLMLIDGIDKRNFSLLQRTGDAALWNMIMFPTTNFEVARNVGRTAYKNCHVILNGSFKLYEVLSCDLVDITRTVRQAIVIR
jgi:hypothetical protein